MEGAKEMIRKMSTKYCPDDISNPTLQRHYAELEALALERSDVYEVVDCTSTSFTPIL